LLGTVTYRDGVRDGPYEWYDANDRVFEKGIYKDGERCGEWYSMGGGRTYDPCPPGLADGN